MTNPTPEAPLGSETHTALPWALDKHGVIKGGIFREYTNGSSQDQIAMVCHPGEDNGSQKANGELIVASVNQLPALRAAAEKALAAWDRLSDTTALNAYSNAKEAMSALRAQLNQMK